MTNPVNHEAGSVPFPDDPVSRSIAETSAAVIWRAFPYFRMRFGGRGQRFGKSDAGWIMTLATLRPSVCVEQVNWLAGVLSCRGIPSWLLEVQLRHLVSLGRRHRWEPVDVLAVGERAP